MSIFCKLGFHSYIEKTIHINWLMSTDPSVEWAKKHSGWHEFRECERCGNIQQKRISVFYGRVSYISKWSEMNKESEMVFRMYLGFNKKN